MYNRNIEARSRNHCCRAKVINIINSESVPVTLVTKYGQRMRRSELPSVSCMALPCFCTLRHKRHNSWQKEVTDRKMRVLISSAASFVKLLIPRRIQRDIIINVQTFACKVPLIFVKNLIKFLIFSNRFSKKKYLNVNFHEMPSLGTELFHADSGNEITKLLAFFRTDFRKISKCQIS